MRAGLLVLLLLIAPAARPADPAAVTDAAQLARLTRETARGGICSWMLRSQRVKNSATQMPASSSSPAARFVVSLTKKAGLAGM